MSDDLPGTPGEPTDHALPRSLEAAWYQIDTLRRELDQARREREALRALGRRLVAALDRCESNRGRFSCVEAHDTRCDYARRNHPGRRCACGADELEAATAAARAALGEA